MLLVFWGHMSSVINQWDRDCSSAITLVVYVRSDCQSKSVLTDDSVRGKRKSEGMLRWLGLKATLNCTPGRKDHSQSRLDPKLQLSSPHHSNVLIRSFNGGGVYVMCPMSHVGDHITPVTHSQNRAALRSTGSVECPEWQTNAEWNSAFGNATADCVAMIKAMDGNEWEWFAKATAYCLHMSRWEPFPLPCGKNRSRSSVSVSAGRCALSHKHQSICHTD